MKKKNKNANNFKKYNDLNNFNENINESLKLLMLISLKKIIQSNFKIVH